MNIGIDEVGRGSFAGPVITGAAIFEKQYQINDFRLPVRIDDSKKLTSKQREESALWIYENAISFSVGIGSVSKINRLGIVKATNFAFRSAIKRATKDLKEKPQKLLIDAFYVPFVKSFPKELQTPIVQGDALIFEIAAASIIAKVCRDDLMRKLSLIHTNYHWDKNKGYGTKEHRNAIQKYGLTKHHRRLYCRNITRSAFFQA